MYSEAAVPDAYVFTEQIIGELKELTTFCPWCQQISILREGHLDYSNMSLPPNTLTDSYKHILLLLSCISLKVGHSDA
jgi:hypothetical protein